MRELACLLTVIKRADLIEYYTTIVSYRAGQQKEIPSLDEFLELTLKEGNEKPNLFDDKTDKFLEEQALKRLNERQQNVK